MVRSFLPLFFWLCTVSVLHAETPAVVLESARELPVAYQADVVVVGGTTHGVAAATAAAKGGVKVFLLDAHTYLGEDVTATLRLWDEKGQFTTPLEVKKSLDSALIAAKVEFLLGSFATDLLKDDAGNIGGVVMANRAGRQAVLAKVVIDATPEAVVGRMAGLAVPKLSGDVAAEWRVIGGAVKPGLEVKELPLPEKIVAVPSKKGGTPAKDLSCHVYTLKLPIGDDSWAARANAEQQARDLTYDKEQLYTSETPYFPAATWSGKAPRLWVISGDGATAGKAAAEEAAKLPEPKGAKVRRDPVKAAKAAGEVKEVLGGVRIAAIQQKVQQEAGALPVIGEYDVVVVGGGTSGACAGIGAARQGVKTLVLEYLHGLGGVGTEGLIGSYYHGNRVGFTKDIPPNPVEIRKDWYRSALRKAGADIWFGTIGCGAFVENGRIRGVVVATPMGRGVVLAKNVVDSTGSSDTAIAAGAAYKFIDESDVAVQGTGLPPKALGASNTNTDFTFADDTDPLNVRAIFVSARKTAGTFDMGQLIDTRERRRIVGEFSIDPLDELNGRTYPDSIVQCGSDFDSHGYTIHPYFTLVPPSKTGIKSFVPYRVMLPKGLDGLLVTGLGISAHRDAMPPIRMQADLHNQGYAAGAGAAMAVKAGVGAKDLDVKKLQKHLVELGNLPQSVLTAIDNYPPSAGQIEDAVKSLPNDYKGAEVVMWNPTESMPLLKAAYEKANGPAKLVYAHTLAMLGDGSGAQILTDAVAAADWDKGWDFKGMGQYGASRSKLDSMVLSLGYTKDKKALPILIAKTNQLTASSEFSHCRAVAVALEQTADPSAAEALAGALDRIKGNRSDRNFALREISLARALLRCGDKDGKARKILEEYTQDTRGPFAQHAAAVLSSVAAEKAK